MAQGAEGQVDVPDAFEDSGMYQAAKAGACVGPYPSTAPLGASTAAQDGSHVAFMNPSLADTDDSGLMSPADAGDQPRIPEATSGAAGQQDRSWDTRPGARPSMKPARTGSVPPTVA